MLYLIFVVCGIILGILISITIFINSEYKSMMEITNIVKDIIDNQEILEERFTKIYDAVCDMEYETEHKK